MPESRRQFMDSVTRSEYFMARPEGPAREHGALDLYNAEGNFIERIALTGDHHALVLDLPHLVPRLLGSSCAIIILYHSHPSGIAQPSEADVHVTRAFARLLRLIGMRLHDHIISSARSHFSFRAEGLI